MRFGFHRPSSLDEAVRLASEMAGAGFIAGGTDLLVQVGHGRPAPEAVISLRGVGELAVIDVGDRVRVGSTATLREVGAHPAVVELFPALAQSIAVLGSPQIRNVATIGGNLCNASPAADTAPPLLVYQASVEVSGVAGSREMPIGEFLKGPGKTALEPGEIVTAVMLEPPEPGERSVFLRRGRVRMDLAIVSVAALVAVEDGVCTRVRLAAGAVAPVPLRLANAESVVDGAVLDAAVRASAAEAARAEISPISDLRSSAEYRRHLTGVLVDRSLAEVGS